jgi:hypothetical protein
MWDGMAGTMQPVKRKTKYFFGEDWTGGIALVCKENLDSSLRDVKQDDSNNEVARSGGGEQIDDILDGLVGAVVGDFESAVWAILRIRTAVEAAVGKWSAQPLVEEQK